MFKIRKSEDTVQSMIDYTRGQNQTIKDFRVGSRVRTLFEAIGDMVEEIYYRLWQGAKALIEEQIYKAFDFGLLPATKAQGTVRFSKNTAATSDIVIAAGTSITTAAQDSITPVVYQTLANATLLTGNTYVDVTVRAAKAGSYANVSENTLTVMQTNVSGIDAVTNQQAIVNGTDEETKEARKVRFRNFIITRSQGTIPALEYAAEQVAGVKLATVRENPDLSMLAFEMASGVYTDNSYECNNPYGTEFAMLPTNPKTGDIMYVGALQKFDFVYFRMAGTYTVGTGVWEYWNGSQWQALTTSNEGTNGLSQSGLVKFDMPSDWRDNNIDALYRFWIRYRLTTDWTQNPVLDHAFASPPPGYVDVYIQDANAEASAALISAVSDALVTYRGSGITVNVRAPSKILLAITCSIKVNQNYEGSTVVAKVQQTIIDHLNTFVLGQNFVISRLETEILNLEEGSGPMVDSVTITVPADDLLASPGEIFRPADSSNISVTAVN